MAKIISFWLKRQIRAGDYFVIAREGHALSSRGDTEVLDQTILALRSLLTCSKLLSIAHRVSERSLRAAGSSSVHHVMVMVYGETIFGRCSALATT
jgi:hypothetical protein